MFSTVRRLFALTALFALVVSCQGPSSDPDPIGELPPISDWPQSGSGQGSFDPGATPSRPVTTPPSGMGTTGGSTPNPAGGGAGGASGGSFDAGSIAAAGDAGIVTSDSPVTGAAGAPDAGNFDADGGVPDGGAAEGGAPEAGAPEAGSAEGGCPVEITPDAGRCFGRGCLVPFATFQPWRPGPPDACGGPRHP